MSRFRWWRSDNPLWWRASLAGAALGALLMAPTGSEIRDGTIGCTSCGTFTQTLIGFDVRTADHGWFVAVLRSPVYFLVLWWRWPGDSSASRQTETLPSSKSFLRQTPHNLIPRW